MFYCVALSEAFSPLLCRRCHAMCDNIGQDIYERLLKDKAIIYVCRICRDEVNAIKKECKREVSDLVWTFFS